MSSKIAEYLQGKCLIIASKIQKCLISDGRLEDEKERRVDCRHTSASSPSLTGKGTSSSSSARPCLPSFNSLDSQLPSHPIRFVSRCQLFTATRYPHSNNQAAPDDPCLVLSRFFGPGTGCLPSSPQTASNSACPYSLAFDIDDSLPRTASSLIAVIATIGQDSRVPPASKRRAFLARPPATFLVLAHDGSSTMRRIAAPCILHGRT